MSKRQIKTGSTVESGTESAETETEMDHPGTETEQPGSDEQTEPEKLPDMIVLRDHFRIIVNGVGRVWERGALIFDHEAMRIILANDDRGIVRKFMEV